MGRRPRGIVWPGVLLPALIAMAFAVWRAIAGDPLTDAVENRLLDLRFSARGAIAPPDNVVIAEIDETFVAAHGWMPPPRHAIATAITTIRAAEPAVIAIDLLFLEQSPAGPQLAAAIAAADNVVVAAAATNRDGPALAAGGGELSAEQTASLDRSTFDLVVGPVPADATGSELLVPHASIIGGAALAHVNVTRSADRVVREVPVALWLGDGLFLPAIGVEAARRLGRLGSADVVLHPGKAVTIGGEVFTTDGGGGVVMNHYGPRGTIPSFGLQDVLDGKVPDAAIRGKAVFIGATAESMADQFATPFGADVPGVEILATSAANLADGSPILRDGVTRALSVLLAGVAAAACALALLLFRRRGSVILLAVVWAGSATALQAAFVKAGMWLDGTALLVALVAGSALGSARRFRWEREQASSLGRQRDNLSRFVAPRLARELAEKGPAAIGQREVDAAVMFVDLAGFTAMSESLPPEETISFLRRLHAFFQSAAERRNGVVISFEGDGALIAFGLFPSDSAPAAEAIGCGLDMLAREGEIPGPSSAGQTPHLRISINHGPVSFAVLGGETHSQVTVAGDTVNVASRLQEVAKAAGRRLVVSDSCWAAAGGKAAHFARAFEEIGEFDIRGRQGALTVHAPVPT